MNKTRISMLGLIFITCLSAIQFIFLRNVPESVSTFSFLCITNVIGLVILGCTQLKKLFTLRGNVLKKGALLAVLLTSLNFFVLLGSRNMDSVIISSIMSMYFIFITPLLFLLRRKVNFFSSIASVIAVIALLLMFGADTDALFGSINVVYLLIADILFACYIVSISILGEDEDSVQLTLAQMVCGSAFALIGWVVESRLGHGSFSIPTDAQFWISAAFIGVFIRAVYGIIQISCQKHVSAISASLIFASEIIITLLLDPLLCRLLGATPAAVTVFQIIGCVLFIIATLMVDEGVMSKFGFAGIETTDEVDDAGNTVHRSSVARKMILSTLTFTMLTLILSLVVCLSAISFIRRSAVSNSETLGETASTTSATALTSQLEQSMLRTTEDKANLAEAKLATYSSSVMYVASYANSLYELPEQFPSREIDKPRTENSGRWAMQRALRDESISYELVQEECALLGNMVDVFAPIVAHVDNISAIYMGMESGLMLSFDPNSESVPSSTGELYYDFSESPWYVAGKALAPEQGYIFTEPYQDSFGRGLTITCLAPVYSSSGNFLGVAAMDILMNDLNQEMVNDGIIDPTVATLIDNKGDIIASATLPADMQGQLSIFDPSANSYLCAVGHEILENKNGLTTTEIDGDSLYIAYSLIKSTEWEMCIMTPVSAVIQPVLEIRNSIEKNTDSVVASVVNSILTVVQSCLVISAVILITVTLFVGKTSRKISDPIKKLELDVREISKGNFDMQTDVRTDDEVGILAESFNSMATSLRQYIIDLKEVTAREQRIASELSFAADIQLQMLPRDFPTRDDLEIYATMTPAKEVGGDFYDFFFIDDTHLAMVMADVSGKGVPAALFMVIAKTLIRSRTLMGGSPAEVLYDVNNELCKGNDAALFVTVWLGILNLTTGKVIEANAGHECPAVRRANGTFSLIKNKHSLAVACMEGMRFRQNEFDLFPGDTLYVYTDGVAEATDANNELYGTERMLAALNADPEAKPCDLLKNVKQGIDIFVDGAAQFDDITMLSLKYYGQNQ